MCKFPVVLQVLYGDTDGLFDFVQIVVLLLHRAKEATNSILHASEQGVGDIGPCDQPTQPRMVPLQLIDVVL